MKAALTVVVLVVLCSAAEGMVRGCRTSDNCPAGECCVSSAMMDGRRRQVGGDYGMCVSFGHSNNACYVGRQLGSSLYYGSCPCAAGWTCVGSGMYDIPMGETGTCHRR